MISIEAFIGLMYPVARRTVSSQSFFHHSKIFTHNNNPVFCCTNQVSYLFISGAILSKVNLYCIQCLSRRLFSELSDGASTMSAGRSFQIFTILSEKKEGWKARFQLSKTKIFINEDFPPEIQAKRQILIPILKNAKQMKKKMHSFGRQINY